MDSASQTAKPTPDIMKRWKALAFRGEPAVMIKEIGVIFFNALDDEDAQRMLWSLPLPYVHPSLIRKIDGFLYMEAVEGDEVGANIFVQNG